MQNFITFNTVEVDGIGNYKQISFDIDALVEKYGAETTAASVPELFPILGFEKGRDIEDVEQHFPPDDESLALDTLGELAKELANAKPAIGTWAAGVASSIGNWEAVYWLIPIDGQ